MKNPLLYALILLLSLSLFGCINGVLKQEEQSKEPLQQTNESDEAAVKSLVENFGGKLQAVSLQAPKDIVNKSIQENYGDLVSPELLAKWLSDPQNAPGRLTSSPWPDRIEILNIEELSEYAYEVKGEIIEMTSVEMVNGGVAAKRPITLKAGKVENRWLIDAVTLGAYEEIDSTVYRDIQYGFRFSLPESWQGYSVITGKWEGTAPGGAPGGTQGVVTAATGPMISIRHPQWTSQNPRQDIPIMIFTLSQWNSLQQGEFHIGAAPVGPRELGRNTGYVFALPARYNYAFPTGYEEVEKILGGNPLQAG